MEDGGKNVGTGEVVIVTHFNAVLKAVETCGGVKNFKRILAIVERIKS
jgi:hypothetical protein